MRRGSTERFADHAVGTDLCPKQIRSDAGDLLPLFVERTRPGNRGRRTNVLEVGRFQLLSQSSGKHCDIRTLPSAIRVKLVEN